MTNEKANTPEGAKEELEDSSCSIPPLKWSRVAARTEPAGNFGENVRVMSEFSVRMILIETLAEYGIEPETEE
jgi:hypothetical protein